MDRLQDVIIAFSLVFLDRNFGQEEHVAHLIDTLTDFLPSKYRMFSKDADFLLHTQGATPTSPKVTFFLLRRRHHPQEIQNISTQELPLALVNIANALTILLILNPFLSRDLDVEPISTWAKR